MFFYVIADRNTGEIVHCYSDTGDGAAFEALLQSEGPPIILADGIPSNMFEAVIKDGENHKDAVFGAKRYREEFRIFPDSSKGKKGFKVEKRAIKAKTNPYDGSIVEDVANFDTIVAATKVKMDAIDKAYKEKMSSPK